MHVRVEMHIRIQDASRRHRSGLFVRARSALPREVCAPTNSVTICEFVPIFANFRRAVDDSADIPRFSYFHSVSTLR